MIGELHTDQNMVDMPIGRLRSIKGDEAVFSRIYEKKLLIDRSMLWHKIGQRMNFLADYNGIYCGRTMSKGQKPDNMNRNRNTDLLPYDSSLVKLSPTAGNRGGYINASLLDFDKRAGRKYILTTAPPASQNECYWQMIWEQRIPSVVVLTEVYELGFKAWEKHYPEDLGEIVQYGIYRIECKRFDNFENKYQYREMLLIKEGKQEVRELVHYKMIGWGEESVPSIEQFFEFYDVVRAAQALRPGKHNTFVPVLPKWLGGADRTPTSYAPIIQCATGNGRSGTLAIIDVFLTMIEKGRRDLYVIEKWILRARARRRQAVKTQQQHAFIYEVVLHELLKRHKELEHLQKYLDEHAGTVRRINCSSSFEVERYIKPKHWIIDEKQRDRYIGKKQWVRRVMFEGKKCELSTKYDDYVIE